MITRKTKIQNYVVIIILNIWVISRDIPNRILKMLTVWKNVETTSSLFPSFKKKLLTFFTIVSPSLGFYCRNN